MVTIDIKPNDIISFTYKNWQGKVGLRKAVVKKLQFGSNDYHKEDQFLLLCFDLDKNEYRTFALKDVQTLDIIERGQNKVYMVVRKWYNFDGSLEDTDLIQGFLTKEEAENFMHNDKRWLDLEEVELG